MWMTIVLSRVRPYGNDLTKSLVKIIAESPPSWKKSSSTLTHTLFYKYFTWSEVIDIKWPRWEPHRMPSMLCKCNPWDAVMDGCPSNDSLTWVIRNSYLSAKKHTRPAIIDIQVRPNAYAYAAGVAHNSIHRNLCHRQIIVHGMHDLHIYRTASSRNDYIILSKLCSPCLSEKMQSKTYKSLWNFIRARHFQTDWIFSIINWDVCSNVVQDAGSTCPVFKFWPLTM